MPKQRSTMTINDLKEMLRQANVVDRSSKKPPAAQPQGSHGSPGALVEPDGSFGSSGAKAKPDGSHGSSGASPEGTHGSSGAKPLGVEGDETPALNPELQDAFEQADSNVTVVEEEADDDGIAGGDKQPAKGGGKSSKR